MNTWLRDLAEQWADARYVKTNDILRRKLIAAEASVERLGQTVTRLKNTVRSFGQLAAEYDAKLKRVEAERDAAQVRQTELEQEIVALSGKGEDEHWADAAGVAGPETRQP